MKKEIIKSVLGIVLFIGCLYMSYKWFDIKLMWILVAFGWMNNMKQSNRK